MNELEPLEWKRFLDLAQNEARTERAKQMTLALDDPALWAPHVAAARLLQQETQEAAQLLDRDALWGPLLELADPEAALDRLSRGAVLEISELALLRRWLYAIDSWTQLPREEIKSELFKKALLRLPDPLRPIQILDRILTPEGDLSERASPALGRLHSEIRALKREISIILDQLMKTLSAKGVLQENFTDVRDGRYVLPVKISSQADVEGIIYEASASRQTVFVEPREVANLNNRLRQRQNELITEIHVVLTEVSKALQPFSDETRDAVEILSHWDAAQARARFGRHFGGKAIEVSEERAFRMNQTVHPLLWRSVPVEKIIRNDIEFGDPVRTLLLTGPNTGGKTVLLKTLGLAALCARTGFPFPAIDHPRVPFFDRVFADLGDPQSIEQHLSTFSGHIQRFRQILENLTDQSLILIDELNSATDPEEGAALGRAFLETIMSRGAVTVTTTHDPHLKAAAVSDGRILNASMQFDESARTPTYRMLLGVPGRSRALETAERLGIPQDVLRLARSYLSAEHKKFEQMLAKLEADSHEADRARREAVHLREEAERLRNEWTERTQRSVADMLDRTRQRLRRVLEQAQDEVRMAVRTLDEAKGKSRKEIDETRARVNETFGIASTRLEHALEEEAPEIAETLQSAKERPQIAEAPSAKIQVGEPVRVPKWKNTGTVLALLPGGKIRVALGKLQMTLDPGDIEPLLASEISAVKSAQARNLVRAKGVTPFSASFDTTAPAPRIDLRGLRLEEAMSEFDSWIDQAFRNGAYVEVTVVHGLGTGAIREAVRAALAKLPYIKEFRDGGPGQGGTGATIVEFHRS
ncbi:MAG: Smr/MutS family protein [Oligoflexia bacterium]|nr:Smr/MutS family protein [Oligoflexia bacterium]